jgi:putative selenium metabolism protein SsnA
MLITHAKLITMYSQEQFSDDSAVLIQEGIIREIGKTDFMQSRFPGENLMDAAGQYVMPGNICAHTHFYGAFARGMGIPGPAPADFPQILARLWWGLDCALTLEDVYYSAMVCIIDAIRHGTTTLVDHHASPNAIEGSLDQIAQAVLESGVRASLSYEVSDRGGAEKAQAGIRENVRFLKNINRRDDQRRHLTGLFGLHASLTLSEKTLEACRRETPDGTGFHIHVAEHPVDEYDSIFKSGLRVIERLEKHGILGPQSIAVHAVHVDAKEMEILAQTNTWVTHQPRSNMNNAVGLPRVEEMLRMGIKVCLGNDGFSNAMWEEWKTAYLAHKLWNQDPRRMPGDAIAQMAIYHNAEMIKHLFHGMDIGIIRPGAMADLIFVDYHPFTAFNPGNLPWHIIFGFNSSMITTTIVDGQVLMKNRQLLTLDEEKIAHDATRSSSKVWQRYQDIMNQEKSS